MSGPFGALEAAQDLTQKDLAEKDSAQEWPYKTEHYTQLSKEPLRLHWSLKALRVHCHNHRQVTEASSICIFDFLFQPVPVQACTILAPPTGRFSDNRKCPSWHGLQTEWNAPCLRRSHQIYLSVPANTGAMLMTGRMDWEGIPKSHFITSTL